MSSWRPSQDPVIQRDSRKANAAMEVDLLDVQRRSLERIIRKPNCSFSRVADAGNAVQGEAVSLSLIQ